MDKETIGFIGRYAKHCRVKMILSVLFSVMSICAGFVPYISVYKLLSSFINNEADMEAIVLWGTLCACGYLFKLVFFEISTTLSHVSAYTILEKIRTDITGKMLKLPLGYVVDRPIGKLKNMIVDQTDTIELPLAHLIPEGTAYILAPLAVFIFLLTIHPLMALSSIISFVLGMIVSVPMMKNMNAKYDEYMASNNYMNSVIVEYIEGIEVIKTFNQTDSSYAKFSSSIERFKTLTLDWFKSTWVGGNLMMAITPTTLLGVLPVGMCLYMNGTLTLERLILSIILSLALMGPLMGLSAYINSLKMIKYAAQSLNEILEEKELPSAAKDVKLTNYDIKFNGVEFAYHEGSEKVIDKLDLEIPEGKFTALIGPSGGGKSTVARLISRFWDVTGGSITIGGTDIKDIPISQLSHIISYVSQDNYLFNCSIKENIRLGRSDATDEEVYEAAKAAMCHDFIMKMEHGYDTMAGEAGDKLSGGEKQRIAIARMILRSAPIVILDEATAYTDPENEDKIQRAIGNLTNGKTLLVIAHRLSTIKNADKIVILEKGAIRSQGRHEELVNDSEIYRGMWEAHIGAKKWTAREV